LGELAEYYQGPRPLFIERVYRDLNEAGRWCDDISTEDVEDCATMSALALDDALETLSDRYGRRIASWRWGEAHRALHKHRTLGDVGTTLFGMSLSLGPVVNIEHETSGGDYTLNRGASSHVGPDPYANIHASGLRAVFDLADLDRSQFIVSTGASGHPLSKHYGNLAPLWRRGELVPMATDREAVDSGALGTLVLVPDQDAESPMLP
jgi:penicillin amidase